MVRALHAAGLEVILDVVYNHTAEGDHLGPTLSFRGIDNTATTGCDPGNPSRYEDFTGCGNTLNMQSPHVLQLMLDSLRYWVAGDARRRLPLRSRVGARARSGHAADRLAAFFDAIAQDPVISRRQAHRRAVGRRRRRLSGRQLPAGWTRVERSLSRHGPPLLARRRGHAARARDAARRQQRSLRPRRPQPHASINFVTSHDGFTLADLVAYNEKHNEANGEENRDGEPHNFSWNCGVEGPTGDAAVRALRERQRRNFLLTLFVSHGVPMISRRRRARPNAARQQQRVLSGLAAHVDAVARRRRGARVSRRSSRGSSRSGPPSPCSRRRGVPRRPGRRRSPMCSGCIRTAAR